MNPSLVLILLGFLFGWGKVGAETVLLLGGEVSSILHPSIASVEAFGACGSFDAGIPDLSSNRREFSAALYGSDLVVCGGYRLLGTEKDCSALTLGTLPLEWREFPSLNHARQNHGLVATGGYLFAVGGGKTIGSEHTIERFNGTHWEEFAETLGFRQDFCTLPWGDDAFLMVGGYDDIGNDRGVDMFNTTSQSWSKLAYLNTGRELHGCAVYAGGVMVAGGWVDNNNPDYPGQELTKSSEWYDPETNSWTEQSLLQATRSKFGMVTLNGKLTALGGWDGSYKDSIEQLNSEDGGWDFFDQRLSQQKAAFGVVKVPEDLLEDRSCHT